MYYFNTPECPLVTPSFYVKELLSLSGHWKTAHPRACVFRKQDLFHGGRASIETWGESSRMNILLKQGSMACCSPWSCKQLDTAERLHTHTLPCTVITIHLSDDPSREDNRALAWLPSPRRSLWSALQKGLLLPCSPSSSGMMRQSCCRLVPTPPPPKPFPGHGYILEYIFYFCSGTFCSGA